MPEQHAEFVIRTTTALSRLPLPFVLVLIRPDDAAELELARFASQGDAVVAGRALAAVRPPSWRVEVRNVPTRERQPRLRRDGRG